MRTAHDLGGEDVHEPIEMEEKGETKEWMSNTYVTCECLAWRGVWNTVEKHRRHVDLGTKQYLELPYYGRWILTAARVLVDKEHVTLTELMNKMEEVKNRL
ncbi:MAG: nitrile hydratase subunit beta [Gammaproteobacteria bacterium]|nr:nitrile hydratase subunit beta [Gammaproteobacteria bacterium]